MKSFFDNRPFAYIGILSVPMLICVILMEIYYPKSNPNGYQSFIVAFEFARTPEQIHDLFDNFSHDVIGNIDTGNYIDFGFMIAYTLFLVLFFRKASCAFEEKWLMFGVPLALIVLLADILENVSMLKITGIYKIMGPDAELVPVLTQLYFATWVKWGGLAVIFALLSLKSLGPRIVTRIEGVVFIIPLLLSFWAISNNPMGVTQFTLSIMLAFLLLVLYCFWFDTKKIEKLKNELFQSLFL